MFDFLFNGGFMFILIIAGGIVRRAARRFVSRYGGVPQVPRGLGRQCGRGVP